MTMTKEQIKVGHRYCSKKSRAIRTVTKVEGERVFWKYEYSIEDFAFHGTLKSFLNWSKEEVKE